MRRARFVLIMIVLVVLLLVLLAFCRSGQETDITVVGTPTPNTIVATPPPLATQVPEIQPTMPSTVDAGVPILGEPSLDLTENSTWRVVEVWENSESIQVGNLTIFNDLAEFENTQTGERIVGRCMTPSKYLVPTSGMLYRADYRDVLQPISQKGVRLTDYQEFLAYPRQ